MITTQIRMDVTIHTSSGFLPCRNHSSVTGIPGKAYSILLSMLRNALQTSYPYPLPLSGLACLSSEGLLFFFIAFNVINIA